MAEPATAAHANRLLAEGRRREAADLLKAAAANGDADALLFMAHAKLRGEWVPRDLGVARDLFRRAAEAGSGEAAAVHAGFLAGGIGGSRAWRDALQALQARRGADPAAARQAALIEAMALTEDGEPASLPPTEELSGDPRVALCRGLFTPDECAFLLAAAEPLFRPAVIVDPRTGEQVRNPVRTSDSAHFTLVLEDPAIHALNRRIAALTGTSAAQGEPLQVLRYNPGQEFKSHSDALPATDNQRVMTVLVYLNEGYGGGETVFPTLGLSIRGRTGDALIFHNVDGAGRPEPRSTHAGLPVTQGTKMVASRWIRARALDLLNPGR